VAAGLLLPIGAIDPANYLQDFAFEKTNTSEHPLLFDKIKNKFVLKAQKSLLQMIKPVRDYKAVDEDIELMNKYYGLLFDQAKTMDMLQ
jgi:hypothetical protein